MKNHVTDEQLISYIYRTLSDSQREMLDLHLATCSTCRTNLVEEERLHRRLHYAVIAKQRKINLPSTLSFTAIQPKLNRNRRLSMLLHQSNQLLYRMVTLLVVLILGFGAAILFSRTHPTEMSHQPTEIVMTMPTIKWSTDLMTTARLKWQVDFLSLSPIVRDEVVYIGGQALRAFDSRNGGELWHFTPGGPIYSTPAVVDDTVYFGSQDRHFYAVNRYTGVEQWRFNSLGGIDSSPTVSGEAVYFGSRDGSLYALNRQTGDLIWQFETESPIGFASPHVADDWVYIGSHDHHLYAIDRQSGQLRWKFETDDSIDSHAFVTQRIVYFGSQDNRLYALDSQTGTERWTVDFQADVYVVGVAAGLVHVASNNPQELDQVGQVYALDSQTGEIVWQAPFLNPISNLVDGVLYISGSDGFLYTLNSQTGETLWSFTAGSIPVGGATAADGVVYFATGAEILYAIQ